MKTLLNRILLTGVTALLAFTAPQTLYGQTARVNPARTSDMTNQDWTLWRVGVLTGEEADKAYSSKNYVNAAALYEKAISHLQALQKSKPHWNRKGVADRISAMQKKLTSSKRLAEKADSSSPGQLSAQEAAQMADIVSEMSALKLTLENAQKQNARYKASLARAEQTAKQVDGLLAEKAEMEKKYSLLLIQYNDLKNKPTDNEADKALKAVLESEKQQSEALRAELKKNKDEIAALNLNTERLKNENKALTESAEKLRQKINAIDRLEKEILTLQQQIRDKNSLLQDQEKKAKADILRVNAELAKKSRQADEANEALNKMRSKMDLNEAARLLERDVATLRAENAILTKEVADREKELNAFRSKSEQSAVSSEQTKALAENLTEQNRQLTDNLNKAGKKLKTLTEENRKLIADLTKTSQEAARLQKERNEFAASLTQKSGEASTQMLAAKAKADEQIKALESANKKLEAARSELEKKNNEAESRIAVLSADLKKSGETLNTRDAELKKLSAADGKLKTAEAQKIQLEKDASKLNDKIAKLTAENTALNKKIAAANETQLKLEKEAAKAAVALREMIAAQNTEKVMLAADNVSLKKRLNEKTGKLTEAENAAKAVPELQKQIKKQEADAVSAQKAFDEARKKSDEQIKKLTADTQKAKDESKMLAEKIADAEKILADEKRKNADRTAKLAESLSGSSRKEIQELTAKVASAEKMLADEKRRNADQIKLADFLRAEKTALEKQLAALKTQPAENKTQKPSADIQEARIRNLTEQQEALKKSLQAAESKIIEKEKELTALKTDLKNTEETMSKLAKSSEGVSSEELVKLREANTRLNETIRAMNAERAKLTENNIKLEKDLRAKQAQLENMRADNAADTKGRKLQADLDAKEKELQKLVQERKTALDSADLLSKEKELLQGRNNELKKNLDEANQKAVTLQSEVRKWSEGTDAVVKEKLAEKDHALDQVMKEQIKLSDEIARLRSELGTANAETMAVKRQLNESKEEQERLQKCLKQLSPNGEGDGTVLYTTSVDPLPNQHGAKAHTKAAQTAEKPIPQLTDEQKKQYSEAMAEAKKFEQEKDVDQALWKYLMAADANPYAWEPRMAIAKIYLDSGKKEQAQKEYLKAIKNGAQRDPVLDKALSSEVK